MDYIAELQSARSEALQALLDIIRTTDDPVEKRHAATAILRAPESKSEPGTVDPPGRASRRSEPRHHSAVPPQSPADRASVKPLAANTEPPINLRGPTTSPSREFAHTDPLPPLPGLPDLPSLSPLRRDIADILADADRLLASQVAARNQLKSAANILQHAGSPTSAQPQAP